MADKKSGKDRLEDVLAWVRGDPEVLADWLATDWEEDARQFAEAGRGTLRENQVVSMGGRPRRTRTGR